jgi:LacI family transcriptional regulator
MPTIGLFMTAEHEETRHHLAGLLRYAAEHPDLNVADFCYPGDDPDLLRAPPWMGKADGIVAYVGRTQGITAWLRRGRVPVVNVCADLKKDFISIFSDPRSVARLAVEHFLGLGFRRFAYVGSRLADGSKNRADALEKELARHALPLQVYHTARRFGGTYEDFTSLDEVEPELVELIRAAEKPLAVVTIHDRWAVVVCRIAEALGLAVPGDVGVVGVCDLQIARISTPPISSVRLDEERKGYEATRLLHRVMRGERLSRRAIQIPALELVERESTIGKQRAAATDVGLALEYIRQHACEGICVKDVAAHVHMALRTFEMQFAAAVGKTAGEEIRQIRVARAKHLLETTDLPITSVARLMALKDGCTFNNFFRRWTGTTPLTYRRRSRQGTEE